ncbi:MAG: metallophosphoesterase family protein [Chloroflexota bacterium]
MKIALLTDVHANLAALQAVAADIDAWGPDRVVVGGDLVNRGPRPRECLELVQQRMDREGWLVTRGNHEEYVMLHAQPDTPASGPAAEVNRASAWTYAQLGRDVGPLQDMPLQLSLEGPSGEELRFVHGSMRGLRDGIYPETTDRELPAMLGLNGRAAQRLGVFAVGHTHRPLVRHLDGVLVVNAGSAGLPFDQDTRPSYARLACGAAGWQAEIVRVDYDLQAAEQDFYTTGYLPDAGPLVRLVQIELRTACSHLYNWSVRYQAAAARGEISMQDSVEQYLAEMGL